MVILKAQSLVEKNDLNICCEEGADELSWIM